jgi:hypothetical protein
MFGYSPGQALGRNWSLLFAADGSGAHDPQQYLRATLDAGGVVCELTLKRADGQAVRVRSLLLQARRDTAVPGFLLIARLAD